MGLREDRAGRNEDSFRKINEAVEQLTPTTADSFQILCECARNDCFRVIEVSRADYEAARDQPARFIVSEGHEVPEIERVVSTQGDYVTVEKIGDAATTAADLDPRS